jgi:hypothetical protein
MIFLLGVCAMLSKTILRTAVPFAAVAMLAGCGGSATTASFNGFPGTGAIWSSGELTALNDYSEGVFNDFQGYNAPSSTGNPTATATFQSDRTALVRVTDGAGTDDTYVASLLFGYVDGANVIGGDIFGFEKDNGDGAAYSAPLDNEPDPNTDFIRLNQVSIAGGQVTSTDTFGSGYFDDFSGEVSIAIVPDGADNLMIIYLEGQNYGDSVEGIGFSPES